MTTIVLVTVLGAASVRIVGATEVLIAVMVVLRKEGVRVVFVESVWLICGMEVVRAGWMVVTVALRVVVMLAAVVVVWATVRVRREVRARREVENCILSVEGGSFAEDIILRKMLRYS